MCIPKAPFFIVFFRFAAHDGEGDFGKTPKNRIVRKLYLVFYSIKVCHLPIWPTPILGSH